MVNCPYNTVTIHRYAILFCQITKVCPCGAFSTFTAEEQNATPLLKNCFNLSNSNVENFSRGQPSTKTPTELRSTAPSSSLFTATLLEPRSRRNNFLKPLLEWWSPFAGVEQDRLFHWRLLGFYLFISTALIRIEHFYSKRSPGFAVKSLGRSATCRPEKTTVTILLRLKSVFS